MPRRRTIRGFAEGGGMELPDVGGSLIGDGGQFSAGSGFGNRAADIGGRLSAGVVKGLASLPRRAIENSQYAMDSGNYDPSVPIEAAMLPMGGGTLARVPARGGEAVLGAGPVRLDSDVMRQFRKGEPAASDDALEQMMAERRAAMQAAMEARRRGSPVKEVDMTARRPRKAPAEPPAGAEKASRLDSDVMNEFRKNRDRDDFSRAKGGQVSDPAMKVARDVAQEAGGDGVHIGAIRSAVAGRTDHHPMEVPSGSYVLPADLVSSLGEGNTESGFTVLEHMFPHSHPLAQAGKGSGSPERRAEGGMISDSGGAVPIMAAGGEFVIAPDDITKRWGDLESGHAFLDHFVKTQRKTLIKTLKGLPGPAQD